MYLVINKSVTAVKVSNFSGHYLRNRSTLDIGVLGSIGIVQHKEHSPEVLSIPPGTPCISVGTSTQVRDISRLTALRVLPERISYNADRENSLNMFGVQSGHIVAGPHPSRPALGPTQSPIQWVPGLSRG